MGIFDRLRYLRWREASLDLLRLARKYKSEGRVSACRAMFSEYRQQKYLVNYAMDLIKEK